MCVLIRSSPPFKEIQQIFKPDLQSLHRHPGHSEQFFFFLKMGEEWALFLSSFMEETLSLVPALEFKKGHISEE